LSVAVARRDFLKIGAAAGGGLLIGVVLPGRAGRLAAATRAGFAPNAFVRIGADELVTVIVNKAEMGQGVYTSMAMLVAEDLEADWSKLRVESAPVDPVYNHTENGIQMTGGSSSVSSEWERMRKAGATARFMLIAAAAQAWGVDVAGCRAETGFVLHPASGRRLSFGALSEAASALPPPADVALKNPADFKILGRPLPRLDTPSKVNGSAQFAGDIALPGMLVALVLRPPVFGATLVKVDASKAKAVPGVRAVVSIPQGVAVAASGFWAAKKGREALVVEWSAPPQGAILSTDALQEQYAALAKTPGLVAKNTGDAEAALLSAARTLSTEYDVPFLAHAMMEPLSTVVDLRADRCEIWTGTQFQTGDRDAAAKLTGLRPETVQIHTTLLGGGFGRRATPNHDFVSEAVEVAKAVKVPVKVLWTREDDIRGGFYRPFWHDRIRGGLDANGSLVAWSHTIVGQSLLAGTPFEAGIKDGVDASSVEGASDMAYAIPNLRVELHSPRSNVPVLWWRSVGHSHTAFVVECFLDELAEAAGRDPLEMRRALLEHDPRRRRVLDLAAERAGWGQALPPGRARGIAVHESFGSLVAQVAEVSLSGSGVRVHRVVSAIDCGRIVNPDTIAAQLEGAVAFGLSAALYGEITLKDGRVEQSNFHDYPILRMNEMPQVDVHIVPSDEKPGGVGEPGVPPVAPAVVNALAVLTGRRIRRLPVRSQDLGLA
jgi:isoquinoline 1-oxidoreductase beta subunit